jgi:hypothetical protein
MADLLHDQNLVLEQLRGLLNLALIDDLDGNLLAGLLVDADLDGGKVAGAENLIGNLVVAFNGLLGVREVQFLNKHRHRESAIVDAQKQGLEQVEY